MLAEVVPCLAALCCAQALPALGLQPWAALWALDGACREGDLIGLTGGCRRPNSLSARAGVAPRKRACLRIAVGIRSDRVECVSEPQNQNLTAWFLVARDAARFNPMCSAPKSWVAKNPL